MWNKLFKSKSKSSKNLSNRSCSSSSAAEATTGFAEFDPAAGGGTSSSGRASVVAQYEQYGSRVDVAPEPVRLRSRSTTRDGGRSDFELQRDSIGAQMCGIPMRRSKLSSAFKSLSLRRSSSKSRLKLAPGPPIPVDTRVSPRPEDEYYEPLTAGKRASLRPCKSDNNLSEKQQYAEAEKEEPVYIEHCQPYEPPAFDASECEPPPNLELRACPICSRKFAPASLTKHIGICERVQTKKRKPFDSSRQRREGTELASYLPKNFGLPQKTVSGTSEAIPVRKLSLSKTPTFERKEFNSTAMSTSMPSHQATSTPRPALKRSMSQQNEPCPYCERCFGMKAYDRHVEWCREKALLSKNAGNNQSISAAKERLQARIQYKAPQIRSKRALNREKYSGSLSCGGSTNSLAELDLHMPPRHNSMSSSVSSDNRKSPHPPPSTTSLQQLSLSVGSTSGARESKASNIHNILNGNQNCRGRGGAAGGEETTRKVTKRTKTFTLSTDRLHSDANNNHRTSNNHSNNQKQQQQQQLQHASNGCHQQQQPRGELIAAGCKTQARNLLNRSNREEPPINGHRQQEQIRPTELTLEKFEIIGHNGRSDGRRPVVLAQKTTRCTMSSSGYSPDRYDPFLSARRQLEELFSPTTSLIHAAANSPAGTSTSTSRLNQTTSECGRGTSSGDGGGSKARATSPHNSNFRRAYSLRMPRKVSRPMYVEKAKSNIQKGITDDGPVSPNFLKSSEYDELPIKSTFNALQLAEPKPKLRDSSTVRKNLKLDLKLDPNHPAAPGDLPLSKTDSLAVFLRYETELALSEKDMKDKSNSLSKRTSSLSAEAQGQRKQPEPTTPVAQQQQQQQQPPVKKPEPPPPPVQQPDPEPKREEAELDRLAKQPKQPQKLVPIKLEPINIIYNGGGEVTPAEVRSPTTAPKKPLVISLDAIIGKPSGVPKAKSDAQYNKENRSANGYIDPKLINKCDNLPISLPVKSLQASGDTDHASSASNRTSSNSSSSTIGHNVGSVEGKQLSMKPVVEMEPTRAVVPPPPPPRTSHKVFQKPAPTPIEQSGAMSDVGSSEGVGTKSSNESSPEGSHSASPVDNRTSEESIGTGAASDKRPQLTRQDREDSGYRTGQDSLPDTETVHREKQQHQQQQQQPVVIAKPAQTQMQTPKLVPSTTVAPVSTGTPGNILNRPASSPSPSAGSQPVQTQPGSKRSPRPAIVSALEDFDVDEFMQSLEDLHRRSPASQPANTTPDYKQSLFALRTQSAGQTVSKRSNSLDSSHSTQQLHQRTETSSSGGGGVPRVECVRVRNGSGTASNHHHHNSSNSSSSTSIISSPSHYTNSFTASNHHSPYYSNPISNTSSPNNNHRSGGTDSAPRTPASELSRERMGYRANSPLVPSRRRPSEESTGGGFSLSSVPASPAGVGSSASSTVQGILPNIHQAAGAGGDCWRNANGTTGARSYFPPASPLGGRNGSYQQPNNNSHHANNNHNTSATTTPTSWPASFHDSRFPADSFDHLERDLLKSVQELDRMCGSSSSVCSIDSEELYSVEDYPLHKRSSERSQASADSAYRSLSTQSPPDYAPPVPLRQGRPGSRCSSTASQHPPNPAESPENGSYNGHATHTTPSLPPLTSAALKGHQQQDGVSTTTGPAGLIMNPMSKFCHECGARFMISSAKFCMSCGVRRIMMD